jgi:hypothetical protein
MRRLAVVAVAAAVALCPGLVAGGAARAASLSAVVAAAGAATWGNAVEVPGTPAHGQGQGELAVSNSVSCASAGNCAAGGYYRDRAGDDQAYVVSEVKGTWGKAIEVPSTAALNVGGQATVDSVSCASAGNCAAGGYYRYHVGNGRTFVVSEVNGTWGKAIQVPGVTFNARGAAEVDSVSCAPTGYCAAAGYYTDRSGRRLAFVASRVNGGWGKAIQVPGTGAGYAAVTSVSCASAGNCGAGGYYGGGGSQAFVVSQINGRWGKAVQVPGTAASGAEATVDSVSCPSAGNCAAAGYHYDENGNLYQGFVVNLVNGTWGQAIQGPDTNPVYGVSCASAGNCTAAGSLLVSEVNGTWGNPILMKVPGAAEGGADFGLYSVSCPSAGNCTAAGYYTDDTNHRQAFVVSQVNGTWGKPIEVPGTAALNGGGADGVSSVSCASEGNCAAAGSYYDYAGNVRAFVVSQVNGRWGRAIQVPGTAALAGVGHATVNTVSCASAGNCSAGGYYSDRAGSLRALVVSEVRGRWGRVIQVPGTAALGARLYATVTSVSCASAGNCAAAGYYIDRSGRPQAFLVSQVKGTWNQAIQVPGTAALGAGGYAAVTSVSCGSAGNCTAGGYYRDRAGNDLALLVSQVNGTWDPAIQVPGTAALGTRQSALVTSVSCPSAGNCGAAGDYNEYSGHRQAFVVSQIKGTWGKAIQVPGTAAGEDGEGASAISVSCASAGNCSAAGDYTKLNGRVFVVSEVKGTWGQAIQVPGLAALGGRRLAEVTSVSCASAGNCAAGGIYVTNGHGWQAFVVSQVKSTWGKAIEMPGTAALNTSGYATVSSVSCPSAGNCSAGGYYDGSGTGTGGGSPFAVSQVKGTWGKAIQLRGTAAFNAGGATVTTVSCSSAGNCAAGGNYLDRAGDEYAFVTGQVKGTWGKAIQVPGTGR